MKIIDASMSSYIGDIVKKVDDIEIVSQVDTLDLLTDYVELDEPDLVIVSKDIDQEPQGENLIKAIREIRLSRPLVRVIVLTPKFERRFYQRLVNLGVFSIITYDDMDEKLLKEIKDPSIGFNFEEFESRPEKREYINKITKGLKRVIAIYSQAPTGKSYVAANLAYTLAGQGIKTALLDCDLKKRSQSYYFYTDKDRENDLSDLINLGNSQDIEEYAHKLFDGKLSIYTTDRFNHELDEIPLSLSEASLTGIIDSLRVDNEVVLLDTNGSLIEITKKALMLADTILLVQNLDFRMMEENKAMLKELKKLNIPIRKIVLVINRYIDNRELTEKIIEKYFDETFSGRITIPEDTLLALKSLRYGKPLVATKECPEKTIEAFISLSQFCYGLEKIEKRRRNILSKFLF